MRCLPNSRTIKPRRQYFIMPRVQNPVSSDFIGQSLITISYDDGLVNNFDYALPLHERYNVPATLNIVAGRIFSPNCFNATMIKNTRARGFEIASHSFYHDVRLRTKTDAEIHYEMSRSKEILSRLIKDEVVSITIPFLGYDERVRSIAKQYYKGVIGRDGAIETIPPEDRYWIYTHTLTKTTTFDDVKSRIDTAITEGKWCIITLHGIRDAPQEELTTYEITPQLLEQILQYISSFGRSVLLPVNTKDALRFMLGNEY